VRFPFLQVLKLVPTYHVFFPCQATQSVRHWHILFEALGSAGGLFLSVQLFARGWNNSLQPK